MMATLVISQRKSPPQFYEDADHTIIRLKAVAMYALNGKTIVLAESGKEHELGEFRYSRHLVRKWLEF